MVENFFRVALILLEVVMIFNLLIIVHELGHFLAARTVDGGSAGPTTDGGSAATRN